MTGNPLMCSVQNNKNVLVGTVKLLCPRGVSWPVFPPVLYELLCVFKVDLLKSWSESKQDAGCFVCLEVGEKSRDDRY